jgi:tripartite-type tricarboxylate transporter receptor subunit TctC
MKPVSSLPYRSVDDFEPIGLVTDVPMTLVAKRDFPAGDLRALAVHERHRDRPHHRAVQGHGASP